MVKVDGQWLFSKRRIYNDNRDEWAYKSGKNPAWGAFIVLPPTRSSVSRHGSLRKTGDRRTCASGPRLATRRGDAPSAVQAATPDRGRTGTQAEDTSDFVERRRGHGIQRTRGCRGRERRALR